MENLLYYLIKASSGIAILYIIYWAFLRKETFHKTNRVYLLVALIVSALMPLFPYQYEVIIDPAKNNDIWTVVNSSFKSIQLSFSGNEASIPQITWLQALTIIYFTGVSIFLFRLLAQCAILVFLVIKHKPQKDGGLKILENERYGPPFSFFNVVFINPKFHKQEELHEILAHEKVHIRENHWFDLLIIELFTVVFWFNPFIWLFERSIKQNHEFLADAGVISRGHSVGKYQALLINQLMGMQIIGVTNNLNFALNTNRLKMMTKQKTPKIRALKLGFVLPAIALLLMAFAEPSYRAKSIDITTNDVSLRELAGDKIIKLVGKVFDEKGNALPGASVIIKGTTNGTVSNKDGLFKFAASEDDHIVVSYVGKVTAVKAVAKITEGKKTEGAYKTKFVLKNGVVEIEDIDKILNSPPPPPPPPAPPKAKKAEKALDAKKVEKAKKAKEEFYIVEEMPAYPGGIHAMAKYVKKMSVKYAKAKKVEGKAYIGFTVGTDGSVKNINVLKKSNEMAAKAAYAIVDGMEKWQPGKQRGKAVPVNYEMLVKF